LVIIWGIWNSVRESRNTAEGIKSVDWLETTGTVSSSEVVWAHVEVQYRYAVNGTEYTGKYKENLTPVMPDKSGHGAQALAKESGELVAQFPLGSKVIVHYNPKRPDESVLYCSAEPVTDDASHAPEFRMLE
jgi:hypothetical protein